MFSKIIKHPVTQIVIGVIVTAAFFFLVEQKEIKPRYAVSIPETLAEATADAPGLKLLWYDEEIRNIHTINVVIWNAGRQFLDKNAISATDPIRIAYPSDIQVLYSRFVRTSRDTLELTATDLAYRGMKAIQVQIVGDEALERGDGGLLRVLFSGPISDEFAVTGRIKGSREGFTRVSWNDVAGAMKTEDWVALAAVVLVFSLGAMGSRKSLLMLSSSEMRRGAKVTEWISALVSLMYIGLGVWMIIRDARLLLFGLAWLP